MGLHLKFSTFSHIGTVVNALEAGNVGMPQLTISLLHWSLCLATHVKSSAKPIIEPWENVLSKSSVRFSENQNSRLLLLWEHLNFKLRYMLYVIFAIWQNRNQIYVPFFNIINSFIMIYYYDTLEESDMLSITNILFFVFIFLDFYYWWHSENRSISRVMSINKRKKTFE